MRWFREHRDDSRLHFFKNLQTDVYVRLMARAACLVGNSSSGIREGAFIGTPAVNIGTRQMNRQRGPNVADVDYHAGAIADAIDAQRRHGRYDRTPIYGDGGAGPRIAGILAVTSPPLQKVLTF
jgi:UDP-N-acetylglucosamine 2-epimerase